MRPLDVLIAGGSIVDGTGSPQFAGAVGVERVDGGEATLVVLRDAAEIAAATEVAEHVIDATGRVVAPGFIDLHSHSGLMILANPIHEPKVRQGVTTEVVGVDGLSYAPMRDPGTLAELVEMNAGLDG
ncbi:MAG TPA: amidohydrolase family protein, partial [Candidatus Limnocylindrales bacterium]